jgi:hypothetical protein
LVVLENLRLPARAQRELVCFSFFLFVEEETKMPALDPIQTSLLVIRTIAAWLIKERVGNIRRPEDIDWTKSLKAAHPDGYQMHPLAFPRFCDEISYSLSISAGRKLTLTLPWRKEHWGDTLGVFYSAVNTELLAAQTSSLANAARMMTQKAKTATKAAAAINKSNTKTK